MILSVLFFWTKDIVYRYESVDNWGIYLEIFQLTAKKLMSRQHHASELLYTTNTC
jgi:hypothetical protein